MAEHCHNTPGLPGQTPITATEFNADYLHELDDCLTLALDVSEKQDGEYTRDELELRRYLAAAKRYANSLIGGAA